jgi:hypothetical protein
MQTPKTLNPCSMQVSLRLDTHHWSDLDIWLEGKHYDFSLTHIFGSPLKAIAYMLLLLDAGLAQVNMTLHEEPGQHEWQLTPNIQDPALIDIRIATCGDNFETRGPPDEIRTFSVHREFFIDSFLAELDKIATLLKHPRFARDRSPDEFPWDEWRKLRQARARSE